MRLATVQDHCLKKKGKITEEFPFGEEALVYKVEGKMFLLAMVNEQPLSINLKCDPVYALELRERYDAVTAGYHMSKKHWNTVVLDGSIPVGEVLKMIDHSYEQGVKGLPLKVRKKLL